jgi:SAM-dependent methyltransferase
MVNASVVDSYDALAAEHADVVAEGLDDRPLDRALFGAFAELVRAGGNDRVADVGCGPGRVTILLSRLGLDAFGIDVSPGMLALVLPDASLGGLLAYYSIIHIPWEQRSQLFTEFHRVLAPGGVLMLVFQIGDDQGHRTEFSGTPISLTFYRQRPDEVAGLLREAGFEPWMTAVRERADWEKTTQGYLIARKPLEQ